jgi:cation transport ATPase
MTLDAVTFFAMYPPLIYSTIVTSLLYIIWAFRFDKADRQTRRTQWYLVVGIAIAFFALTFEQTFWFYIRLRNFPHVTPLVTEARLLHTLPIATYAMGFLWIGSIFHQHAYWRAVVGGRAAWFTSSSIAIGIIIYITCILIVGVTGNNAI